MLVYRYNNTILGLYRILSRLSNLRLTLSKQDLIMYPNQYKLKTNYIPGFIAMEGSHSAGEMYDPKYSFLAPPSVCHGHTPKFERQ